MKKLYTLLFAATVTFSTYAQTDQGSFLIMGSSGIEYGSQGTSDLNVGNYDSQEDVANEFEINILGGYFITDGLALGLSMVRDSEWSTSTSVESLYDMGYFTEIEREEESSLVSFIFAPTLRYYFSETGAWIQASYGFGSISHEADYSRTDKLNGSVYDSFNDSYDRSDDVTAFSISAGYAIYLSDYISLNPTIGYNITNVTIEDGNAGGYNYNPYTGGYNYTSSKDLDVSFKGMSLGFGIAFHFM